VQIRTQRPNQNEKPQNQTKLTVPFVASMTTNKQPKTDAETKTQQPATAL
jgi:hypothetical protein